MKHLLRRGRTGLRIAARARAVLLAAAGVSTSEIARRVGRDRTWVRDWIRRFGRQRLAGLLGPCRGFSGDTQRRQQGHARFCGPPIVDVSHLDFRTAITFSCRALSWSSTLLPRVSSRRSWTFSRASGTRVSATFLFHIFRREGRIRSEYASAGFSALVLEISPCEEIDEQVRGLRGSALKRVAPRVPQEPREARERVPQPLAVHQ